MAEDIIIEKLNGYYEFELEDGDTRYAIYDDQVSEVIKQVSWPQKLINDLQVIYKDININQMIYRHIEIFVRETIIVKRKKYNYLKKKKKNHPIINYQII